MADTLRGVMGRGLVVVAGLALAGQPAWAQGDAPPPEPPPPPAEQPAPEPAPEPQPAPPAEGNPYAQPGQPQPQPQPYGQPNPYAQPNPYGQPQPYGQPYAQQDPYFHNQGFMIGVGLGIAVADCDGCESETSVGFDFNIGGFMNPRLALMYDANMWADSENDATLVLSTHTVAAQYWATPQLWLKGGLGLALIQLSVEGFDSDSENGTGLTFAGGYELMQSGNFALDVSGRFSLLDFDGGSFNVLSVLFGARWK